MIEYATWKSRAPSGEKGLHRNISYATAWPSSDPTILALQQQARDWWTNERPRFSLVASQLVIAEASAGDPVAAADRLAFLQGVPLVPITDDARKLANELIAEALMPQKAAADATAAHSFNWDAPLAVSADRLVIGGSMPP